MELTNKIKALKKRCEDGKEETKPAKESTEASRSLMDSFIITQAEHKSNLSDLRDGFHVKKSIVPEKRSVASITK